MLQLDNTAIGAFQWATLGPVRNFDIVSSEFVHILHTGNSHWVCISSVGCLPGHVNLYDSLYDSVLSQEIEEQANDLLGARLEVLNPMPVQQQRNCSDCWVFAIASHTCLVFGEDPTFVNFEILRMRSHLAACLRNGRMSLFPSF